MKTAHRETLREISAAVRLVPVKLLRIVQTKGHLLLAASLSKLSDHVASKGRRIDDVVRITLGFEHRKSLVVLCRHHDILHSRLPSQRHPLIGIKKNRIECRCQLLILSIRNSEIRLDPFSGTRTLLSAIFARKKTVKPPVDHHSKLRLTKPTLRLRLLINLVLTGDFSSLKGVICIFCGNFYTFF